MQIFLEDLNRETTAWFEFKTSSTEPEEATVSSLEDGDVFAVEIRLLNAGESDEIADRNFSTQYVGDVGGKLEQKLVVNNLAATELLVQKAVAGWRGAYEDRKKHKPLQCNNFNKKRLLQTLPGFGEFVKRCHKVLADRHQVEVEELEKNSEKSGAGSRASTTSRAKSA